MAAAALLHEDVANGLWLLILPAGHFTWQVATLDINDGEHCLRLFKSNIWAGALLCVPPLMA